MRYLILLVILLVLSLLVSNYIMLKISEKFRDKDGE